MSQPENTPAPLPSWWKEEHNTAWDCVKAAVRRDWEQTKSDLTRGRDGMDLNQDAGDTLAQALGKERLPRAAEVNPMTPDERAAHVHRAATEAARGAERAAGKERDAVAKSPVPGPPPRTPQVWEQVEAPMRFGYGAAVYSRDLAWGDATEARLRDEWRGLHGDGDWDVVRDSVRAGWLQGRAL